MSTVIRSILEPAPGFASQEVASFIAQLDDQLKRLTDATRDMTPEELEWQPRPGTNTMGMLLAHLAIVEVFWTALIVKRDENYQSEPTLGIGMDDDGMPIPEEGLPPATLAGRDLAFFDDLLARGRAFLKDASKEISASDLEREIPRTRADGTRRLINVRWYYYHVLEHFAGHYGQILLLRHLYRAAQVPAKA
jgi:DinB superfamily